MHKYVYSVVAVGQRSSQQGGVTVVRRDHNFHFDAGLILEILKSSRSISLIQFCEAIRLIDPLNAGSSEEGSGCSKYCSRRYLSAQAKGQVIQHSAGTPRRPAETLLLK